MVLSRLVYQTYSGYVLSQFKKLQADLRITGSVRWKHVMHLLRLLDAGWSVDALKDVIDWHRAGLVPLGAELTSDPRCRFVNADFFALVDSEEMDSTSPGRRFDAILVDIDHSPRHLLHPRHAMLYTHDGLVRVSRHLRPGGVFGLWSNDPPDAAFQAELDRVFEDSEACVVKFPNPLLGTEAACTVYIGRTPLKATPS